MRTSPAHPRRPRLLLAVLAVAACGPLNAQPQVFGPPANAPPAAAAPAAAGEAEDGADPDAAWQADADDAEWQADTTGAMTGVPPPVAPAATSSLTLSVPGDWKIDGGWYVHDNSRPGFGYTAVTRTLVRAMPPMPAVGDPRDALVQAVRAYVPAELQPKMSEHFRRYVGDGLAARWVHGQGIEHGHAGPTWFALYLIECGATRQPLVVASTYDEVPDHSGGWEMSVGPGLFDGMNAAEPVLATVRCDGTRNADLFDRASFARRWYFGSGALAGYVNIYTGETSTHTVSYAGDYDLRADGSSRYHYSSAVNNGGGTVFGEQGGPGQWTFTGDTLTITVAGLSPRVFRVASLVDFPDASVLVVVKPDVAPGPTGVARPDTVFTTTSTYAP